MKIIQHLLIEISDKLKLKALYENMIVWRERKIPMQNFIIILSLIVGVLTAFAAIVLKNIIHLIKGFLEENINIEGVNYLYLLFPAMGILLASLFVRYIVKDDISHGITKILFAISQRKARIKPHNIWSSMVASGLTIGFGGSVGAEAPIVLTGSAIGSNLGRFFKMDQKTLMMLVGCGAAGAIGGIFNAPIAGVVFTLEVLMYELTMTSVVPLLISAVTATSVSYFFMGSEVMFDFSSNFEPFSLRRIPYLLVLGVMCGFVSLYFTRGMNRIENFFRKRKNPYTKLFYGGLTLSLLIFLLPALYGEGYDTIAVLLGDDPEKIMEGSMFYAFREYSWVLLIYLGLTVLFKIVASASTNGAGGTGGIFAPSLFVGCLTGYLVAAAFNQFGFDIPERNFAFAGMAGVMSAVMHAPLTGIFLIAELTGGYSLFMSLMITSVVAFITIRIFEPHSLYSMRLAKKGELLTHNKDKAVLTFLTIDNVIDKTRICLNPDMKLGEVVKILTTSKANIFPVIDKKGYYLGELNIDEIRNIMFRPELYSRFRVRRLMVSPPETIKMNYSMDKIMKVFENTSTWDLPVVDDAGKYQGYISKSEMLSTYRQVLLHFSDE